MHRWVIVLGSALLAGLVASTCLPAAPTVEVSGRAVLADGKTPWAGAKVGLFAAGSAADDDDDAPEQPVRQTTTDGRGRFSLAEVPPGPWWVAVRSATEPAVMRFARVEAGGGPVTVTQGRARLRGQVLWSEGGEPVPFAALNLNLRWPDEVASPDASCWACERTTLVAGRDGRFELNGLAPGRYGLSARSQGGSEPLDGPPQGDGSRRYLEFVVPDDQQLPAQTIVLKPWQVTGTVLSVDGRPAADVSVTLARPEDGQLPVTPTAFRSKRMTRTDVAGQVTIPRVGSGRYWLWARAADGSDGLADIGVGEQQREPVTLPLLASGIEGQVFDAEGRPLAGVEVVCNGTPLGRHPRPGNLGYPHTVRDTDAAGRFEVPGLPPGTYRLIVRSHGPVVTTTERLSPTASMTTTSRGLRLLEQEVKVGADERTTVRLALLGSGIAGQVVRPDGTPVPDAAVSAGRGRVWTGADGRFEFASVSPGECLLTVSKDQIERNQPVVVVKNQVANAKVVLPDFVPKLTVVLRRPDGRPAPSQRVYGVAGRGGPANGPPEFNTRTDAAGNVSMKVPHAVAGGGELGVIFFVPNLGCVAPTTVPYDDQPATTIPLRLEVGGTIEGVTTDELGQPLGGVTVSPYIEIDGSEASYLWASLFSYGWSGLDEAYPGTVSRTGDGQFRLGPLPPGRYSLRGVVSPTDPVTVTAGQTVTVNPIGKLRQPTVEVSGRVVSHGNPLANREVALWFFRGGGTMSPTPTARRVITDAEGRFTVEVWASDECWVSAWPNLHPRQPELRQGQRVKLVAGQSVELSADLEVGED